MNYYQKNINLRKETNNNMKIIMKFRKKYLFIKMKPFYKKLKNKFQHLIIEIE